MIKNDRNEVESDDNDESNGENFDEDSDSISDEPIICSHQNSLKHPESSSK